MSASLASVSYIAATILFILSLGGLSNPETARRGNLYGIIGMAIAVLATIFGPRVTMAGIPWIVATMVVGGVFWLFATVGIEQRVPGGVVVEQPGAEGLSAVLREIWSDHRTRRFFFFLGITMFSAWAKDAILEPFGADVFGLSMGVTTRFNSYWQMATVITLVTGSILWRKRPPEQQGRISSIGLLVMALGMVMMAAASIAGLLKAHRAGIVPRDATIVCTVTGHGLKDPQWALRTADGGDVTPVRVPVDAFSVAVALGLDG